MMFFLVTAKYIYSNVLPCKLYNDYDMPQRASHGCTLDFLFVLGLHPLLNPLTVCIIIIIIIIALIIVIFILHSEQCKTCILISLEEFVI